MSKKPMTEAEYTGWTFALSVIETSLIEAEQSGRQVKREHGADYRGWCKGWLEGMKAAQKTVAGHIAREQEKRRDAPVSAQEARSGPEHPADDSAPVCERSRDLDAV